jgi:hypothetical protein
VRRVCSFLASLACVSAFIVGCGPIHFDPVSSAPNEPDPPGAPGGPPTTGQVWEDVALQGDCGRETTGWVLVDEACGALDAKDYLARFRAPMFRDGAVIGAVLYTVDGTNLWSLDVSDPSGIPRKSLSAGLGTPLSVGTHAGQLVIAAGAEGLLVIDVTDPAAPARAATVALDGPALDVHVEGDRAYVALGAAGMAVIDLAASPPAVVQQVAIEGFAAGISAAGSTAYVAACDALVVVDTMAGKVLGKTWVEKPYVGPFLVAPAKDVEIVGSVAYVAAGRFGAVAVDVSKPEAPAVVGNCTVEKELNFYASGVRAENGKLFIAGGEWGVLPIDLAAGGCTQLVAPTLPEYPVNPATGAEDPPECSAKPPWQVVSWQDSWAPPAWGRDPIQTLPGGDVLYAFGDARRNALRAVDVKDTKAEGLPNVGRYEEPRLATGLAAAGNRVVALGKGGGVFVRDEAALLLPVADAPALPADATAVALLDDGRWVAATESHEVYVAGKLAFTLTDPLWPFGLAASGHRFAVTYPEGVYVVDADSGAVADRLSGAKAELPASLFWGKEGLALAGPEWTHAVTIDEKGVAKPLAAHGVFSEEEILKTSLWRRGLPARMLLGAEVGLIEVASLGGHAGLYVHASGARLALPPGEYRGGTAAGKRVYLVAADRAAYRSQLVTVDVGAAVPAVLSVQSFVGVGTGVAVDDDRLYLADGDRGVRVYARSDAGVTLLGVVSLQGVTP